MQTCLVNLADLDPPINGGAARVARAVCQMLLDYARVNPQLRIVFVVNWTFAARFQTWVGDPTARVFPYIVRDTKQGITPLLKALRPDFLISPLFGMQPFHDIPEYTGIPHVVAVPDALALDLPALFTRTQLEGRRRIYAALARATVIVTLTRYARGRLLDHLSIAPERVTVAYLGADVPSSTAAGTQHEESRLETIPVQPYVFYPANTWVHKRHELLLQIMKIAWQHRPELRLVLTGGRTGSEIGDWVMHYSCPQDKVLDLGYVDDEQLKALYQHAEAMIFTSAHEGFGMPLVEAMLNRCPVICAPLTAIPEVAGDAALYVDSDQPDDWARAFLDQLPPQRDLLIEKGLARARQFTWERAKQTWANILMDAGLHLAPISESVQQGAPLPDVSLDLALAELNDWHRRILSHQLPSVGGLYVAHLKQQLEQIEAIRLAENQSRWARLPLIGYVFRVLLRLLNLGRMWNANTQFYRALIEHIDSLEARLPTVPDDET